MEEYRCVTSRACCGDGTPGSPVYAVSPDARPERTVALGTGGRLGNKLPGRTFFIRFRKHHCGQLHFSVPQSS